MKIYLILCPFNENLTMLVLDPEGRSGGKKVEGLLFPKFYGQLKFVPYLSQRFRNIFWQSGRQVCLGLYKYICTLIQIRFQQQNSKNVVNIPIIRDIKMLFW